MIDAEQRRENSVKLNIYQIAGHHHVKHDVKNGIEKFVVKVPRFELAKSLITGVIKLDHWPWNSCDEPRSEESHA
jgi:hypothetical protein